MEKTLKQLLVEQCDLMLASGAIEAAIAKSLDTLVKEVLKDALTGYKSAFRDQLTKAVNDSFQIGEALNLPSYNDLILKIVRRQVQEAAESSVQRRVAEHLESLLIPAPESIALENLVEKYREYLRDQESGACVCFGDSKRILLEVDQDRDLFVYVKLSKAHDDRTPDFTLGLYKSQLFSLRFGRREIEKELFVGTLYGFERMLFQMMGMQSTITGVERWQDIETEHLEVAH